MMGANHYYENRQGKFSEQTKQYFPKTSWGAMGIKFFDFDNDGRMDLFVTDMHSDMWWDAATPDDEKKKAPRHEPESFMMGPADSFVFGNSLYHNLGGGKFEEVSDRMGAENLLAVGPEHRRRQRRRLGRYLHRVFDEFSLPLRHQFAAAEQSRRRSFWTRSFFSASSRGETDGPIPPGSTWIVPRLRPIRMRTSRGHARGKRERSR